MRQRERINYRQQCFSDPDCDTSIVVPYQYYISNNKCNKLFELYSNDSLLVHLFDKDHSMIAIPYYRISRIFEQMPWNAISNEIKKHILSICNNIGISIWFDIYNLRTEFSVEDNL